MFMVTDEDAAAIRATFEQHGDLAAALELRRRFPGIADNAQALTHARIIAGWRPPPSSPQPTRQPRKRSPAS